MHVFPCSSLLYLLSSISHLKYVMVTDSYGGFSRNVQEQDTLDISSQLSLVLNNIVLSCGILLQEDAILSHLISSCF
jgi:hypothetical protein